MVNLVAEASEQDDKCPWCGADARVRIGRYAGKFDCCAKCGFPFPTPDEEKEDDKPVKRW